MNAIPSHLLYLRLFVSTLVVGGACFIASFFFQTHSLWHLLLADYGITLIMLSNALRLAPLTRTHIGIFALLGVIFSAQLAWSLWSRIGARALVPAFLLAVCTVVFSRLCALPHPRSNA